MKQRRVMRIAVALVLALGVRAAHALPTQMIDALRAITCCAQHCGHAPVRPMVPARCCAVSQDATDQARATNAQPEVAAVATLDLPLTIAPVRPSSVAPALLPAGHDRDGPIFLLTCSLRR